MKLITRELQDNHNIFVFGDVHEGSVLSSVKGFQSMVNMMDSEYEGCKNNYGIDMGDMIEAIMVDDKRFSEDKLTEPLPLEQVNKATVRREPIKDRLLCILEGNHERKLWRFGNLTEEVCKRLGVEFGTYTAKITIQGKSGDQMYKMFVAHGNKSINSAADDPTRRIANMKLSLKRSLKFKAGDCAVMVKGHTHKLIVCEPEPELYLTDDCNNIKQGYTSWGQNEDYIHPDARWYGNSGSFLKLYGKGTSGYAEIAEYDPIPLGWLVLRVRRKKIVSLDPVYLKI